MVLAFSLGVLYVLAPFILDYTFSLLCRSLSDVGRVIQELVSTEHVYVNDLTEIIEVIRFQPMSIWQAPGLLYMCTSSLLYSVLRFLPLHRATSLLSRLELSCSLSARKMSLSCLEIFKKYEILTGEFFFLNVHHLALYKCLV